MVSSTPARDSAELTSFTWPSADALQRLTAGDASTCNILASILTETVRVCRMEYGRLTLSTNVSGTNALVCCVVRGESVPPVREFDWLEQQIIGHGSPFFISAIEPLPYFSDALGLPPPIRLMAAPIVRENIVIGVVSLGSSRNIVLKEEDLHQLTEVCDRIASLVAAPNGTPMSVPLGEVLSFYFSSTPWPILLGNSSGALLNINPAAERLLERTAERVSGLPVSEVLQVDESITPRTGGVAAFARRADGSRQLVEMTSSEVRLADGRLVTLMVLRDLSNEQLLLEERLKTAELAGIFRTIATVNHEINNPLFGLTATMQLLHHELGVISDSVEKKLDRMAECCERIKQITENLSQVIRPAQRTYAAGEGMLDLARATSIGGGLPSLQQESPLSADDVIPDLPPGNSLR
ncbi:MAG: histidine kinase dimerization/phospho-acceptor domain-containing protein [Armatimonadota bacterium]